MAAIRTSPRPARATAPEPVRAYVAAASFRTQATRRACSATDASCAASGPASRVATEQAPTPSDGRGTRTPLGTANSCDGPARALGCQTGPPAATSPTTAQTTGPRGKAEPPAPCPGSRVLSTVATVVRPRNRARVGTRAPPTEATTRGTTPSACGAASGTACATGPCPLTRHGSGNGARISRLPAVPVAC